VDSDGGWCPSSHQRNHWVVLREETNEQFSHQRRHATLFAKDGEKLKFGQLARPPSMRFCMEEPRRWRTSVSVLGRSGVRRRWLDNDELKEVAVVGGRRPLLGLK
jgi:hypothetical protein